MCIREEQCFEFLLLRGVKSQPEEVIDEFGEDPETGLVGEGDELVKRDELRCYLFPGIKVRFFRLFAISCDKEMAVLYHFPIARVLHEQLPVSRFIAGFFKQLPLCLCERSIPFICSAARKIDVVRPVGLVLFLNKDLVADRRDDLHRRRPPYLFKDFRRPVKHFLLPLPHFKDHALEDKACVRRQSGSRFVVIVVLHSSIIVPDFVDRKSLSN